MNELLSIPLAAQRLGVSETIVRRLMKRGDLATAKEQQIGKHLRRYVRADDVEALRKQRSGETQ